MKEATDFLEYRIENDSLGEVKVPLSVYWGAQTERSRRNFNIGPEGSMPIGIIHAFGIIKKACAIANYELGVLGKEKKDLICLVCDEILDGRLDDHFPLVIWQTGSGTQTNMNINEVITNRAHVKTGHRLTDIDRELHPNDDVNKSQSSNDTFPAAMHIATSLSVTKNTIPGIRILKDALNRKAVEYSEIVKIGRTHLMDAVPLTLGQEISGYVTQLENGIRAIENALIMTNELALGGSAVGTGLNTPSGFSVLVAEIIAGLTGLPFVTAPNKFESLAAHDAMVEISSALKRVAISLMKIANDIRFLGSGPRCGIGELILPANEPGSSIMPGKTNPTQAEALTMVCAQVMANDLAVSIGGANGHFELNTFKPLIASNVLQSASLLGDACRSFSRNCVEGMQVNEIQIRKHLENSLMLITSLTPYIGYDKSAEIALKAYRENISLRDAALDLGWVSEKEFNEWVDPFSMV